VNSDTILPPYNQWELVQAEEKQNRLLIEISQQSWS